ncbi:ribosome biogenesis GTPase Der [Caulobacter mirabilis]|uniref:GTPase Der n=1 Tax=Caulobacter mirabilis TaxID=69666 RepID=A0A2D2AZ56_9CAUL|nr:ribosome biogenesis GTPase Der [Caulobacter mirabilis]ATQ43272.1 ribosome biogenesis GTPase Der [Caulobacter mirabilis]
MPLKLAIVGRPNVGKSTLFNRLAGKKLAIVDDQPGVTRDRRFAKGNLGDLELTLIDTAGFEDSHDESLESRMRQQTERAIEEAQVVLFLIDSREGITPGDEIFAQLLRLTDKPVILAANKAEGRQGDAGIAEAWSLGFGEPLPLSGEHGEGMAELYAALVAQEALANAEEEEAEDDKPIRIAIVGRPNAGKSTLVNRLIGEDRMLTGPEAGITRDSISVEWEHAGRKVRLVDTAGLRRKARVQDKLEKMSTSDTIRAITFAEVVLLVMDATHPFEIQDLQIADLIEREGRALVFVLAKWDLVEDPQAQLKAFIEHAERMLPQVRGAPVVALSAANGRGVERLMPAILKTYENWSTKVKTRDLNDWLAMAIQRHPPPAVNGRRIKPKYMAQTKARPPTFVLFSSRADQMPEQYRRYLVNSLRESFDLPGVPIRVTLKSNRNPYAEGEEKGGAPSFQQGGKAKKEKAQALAAEARAERAEALAAGGPPVKPKAVPPRPTGVKAAKARAAAAAKYTKSMGAKGGRAGIAKLRGGASTKKGGKKK